MSVTAARAPVVLEPASQAFVEATAKPPFLYQLTPAEARKVLDDVQAAPVDKLPVEDRWVTVPAEVGDVRVVHQSMYYPVTDAAMDTGSYEQFAEGYFLTAKSMAWFWDAYLPDAGRRFEPFASPLRASDEQLSGLPPALVIVDEADVLRDEGEAYAARLRGRRRRHDRPLRRHHPRLHDAQPAQPHPRHPSRHRAGHLHPPRRVLRHLTHAVPSHRGWRLAVSVTAGHHIHPRHAWRKDEHPDRR